MKLEAGVEGYECFDGKEGTANIIPGIVVIQSRAFP